VGREKSTNDRLIAGGTDTNHADGSLCLGFNASEVGFRVLWEIVVVLDFRRVAVPAGKAFVYRNDAFEIFGGRRRKSKLLPIDS